MGLSRPALRFLLREHSRDPFHGPVLLLGRQNVYATLDDALAILRSERVAPVHVPEPTAARNTIPAWAGTPHSRNLADAAFFSLLGLNEVQALDVDSFEGAEIVHDLNCPVPVELENRFGLIVDGGTLEHVFDVRQALSNVAAMLRLGGRVIHLSPGNNYLGHGFYQFSPTLFYDYYDANGFVDVRCFLVEHSANDENAPWDVCVFPHNASGSRYSSRPLAVLACAQKGIAVLPGQVPTQAFYGALFAASSSGRGVGAVSWRSSLAAKLPSALRRGLKRYVLRSDQSVKPWGLHHWGTLHA